MKKQTRKATDYLQVGDMVVVPESIPVPIIYTAQHQEGVAVRMGVVSELMASGGVAVTFAGKTWDYSSKEALRFSRVF